jgi:transposase
LVIIFYRLYHVKNKIEVEESMSLPKFKRQAQLFGIYGPTGLELAPEDRYRLFAEKIYPLLAGARPELEKCYCQDNGRPSVEPVLVSGVTLMQFVEKVPDREAIERLRYHLGWKYALNHEMNEPVFDATVLVRFRGKLLEHEQSRLLFERITEGLQEVGLIPRKYKQRLDSSHVLGMIAKMSRLECVRESIRLVLRELDGLLGERERPEFWGVLWERYVESKLDYKSSEVELKNKMQQAGEDIQRLRKWRESQKERQEVLEQAAQVKLLDRVFGEQYVIVESEAVEVRREEPAGAVQNPHDPDVEWAAKGQGKNRKEFEGYKVQVAETVSGEPLEKGEPTHNFLTAVSIQRATGSDEAGRQQVLEEQGQMGWDKPEVEYVDGAYVSAQEIVTAKEEGRQLMGPVQPAPSPRNKAFSVEAFEVVVEERKALCPAGKQSTQCSRLEEEKTGRVSYRFEWSWQCRDCPLRKQCVGRGQKHRSLVVGEHHSVLQKRRQEMKTLEFQEAMKNRNAIEGTQSELVRAHGARRARYRGLGKVRLQYYLIGAACNIKRWIRRLGWKIKKATQRDSYALASC